MSHASDTESMDTEKTAARKNIVFSLNTNNSNGLARVASYRIVAITSD